MKLIQLLRQTLLFVWVQMRIGVQCGFDILVSQAFCNIRSMLEQHISIRVGKFESDRLSLEVRRLKDVLFVWVQMRIGVQCGFDILVSQAFCNLLGRNSHLNQKAGMAVTK